MVHVNCSFNWWKECEARRKSISVAKHQFWEFQEERRKLAARRAVIDIRISREESRGFHPSEILKGWIKSVDSMEQELVEIVDADNNRGFCYKRDFSAYERVPKIIDDLLPRVKALGKETMVESDMFVRAHVDHLPVEETIGMDSVFNEVWHSIIVKNLQFIRICGMPGVGKTVLMKRIHNMFKQDTLYFNVVIWVDSSNTSDVLTIQLAIAEKLGLTWRDDANQQTRTRIINNALRKTSFVLFLNDPHNEVTLEEVGIETHRDNWNNNYKVVFDTRNSTSLGLGGNQYRSINVGLLTEEYAWKLFEKSVGDETLNSHPDILDLAKILAEKCDRLPLTLVTIGLAMQSKTAPEAWLHAIDMVMNHAPGFENIGKKVYKEFLVCYDGLEDIAKQCFLYCSLFPRECSVEDEELIYHWHGENFFMKSQELDSIRNQGHYIINSLCSAHLLEKDNHVVKMHDATRGCALWIAGGCQEERNAYLVKSNLLLDEFPASNMADVERISLVRCQVDKLNQSKSDWSKLSTLILKGSTLTKISPEFFQPMIFLKVLDLSSTNIHEFPSYITNLVSLQFLNLSYTFIQKLPIDVKNLTKLKFLDLSHIIALQKIPTGVIRSLTNLQVLKMFQCGSKHDQDIEEEDARSGSDKSLSEELKFLHHLQDLRITATSNTALQSYKSSTKLHCIRSLFITKCVDSTSLQLPPVQNLKDLKAFHVVECPHLEDIRMSWGVIDEKVAAQSYRRQESEISSLPGISFKSLAHVEINTCWGLENLTWLTYAPNLESLKVESCIRMKQVVGAIGSTSSSAAAGDHEHRDQLFSRLKSMELIHLPELSVIYGNGLPFPSLEEITVISCSKLSKLPLLINSANKTLKSIRGKQKWWDRLEWENDDAKTTYMKYFQRDDPLELWNRTATYKG